MPHPAERDASLQMLLQNRQLLVPALVIVSGVVIYRIIMIGRFLWVPRQPNRPQRRIIIPLQQPQQRQQRQQVEQTSLEQPKHGASLPTPTISPEEEKMLMEMLIREDWTKGLGVRINPETYSISIFSAKDGHPIQQKIPLRYNNIPIIPHNFQILHPCQSLRYLRGTSTLPAPDGLTDDQIAILKNFLPPFRTVDFYFDREVAVTLDEKHYWVALAKLGANRFTAFHCIFTLLVEGDNDHRDDKPKGERDWIRDEYHVPDQTSTAVIFPGSKIQNKRDESSTLGSFLSTSAVSCNSSMQAEFFTVSTHSFIRKKTMIEAPIFRIAVLFILVLVCSFESTRKLFPLRIYEQTLWSLIWVKVIVLICKHFLCSKVYHSPLQRLTVVRGSKSGNTYAT